MKTSTTLFVLWMSVFAFSQQNDTIGHKIPSFIFKVAHGMTGGASVRFTTAEWEKLTPGLVVGDSMISGQGMYMGKDHVFHSDFYLMFSFSLINGKKKQAGKKFRSTTNFHVGYGPRFHAEKHWYSEDYQIIDQLVSSQTGEVYNVSGVRRHSLSKTYQSSNLAFGVGQHVSTNPNKVFMFETGLDVLCLMSLVSEVNSSYMDSYSIEGMPSGNDGTYTYQQPALNDPELRRYGGEFLTGLIMRFPLDMSFRLSNKNPVMKQMRIGWELNPGLAVVFAKGKQSNHFNMSGGVNFRFAF